MCVHLGAMSVEKQGAIKSELSADGGLKLTIKRQKTAADDPCKPEWVTESRGTGLSKLVIKRKSPGSAVAQPAKSAGSRVDRETEQRPKTTRSHADQAAEPRPPILRLSITSSTSSDGGRHAQVKSWSSSCEVSSAVEDGASASELSPGSTLQQSPKDSGIDMSSPPHDDAAVCADPSAAGGIWTATDPHPGDSSATDVEKMTMSCLEKLETTVSNFVRAEDCSAKTLWPDTVSRLSEYCGPKIRSTLRSRGERSVLKSLTAATSQKFVNPLAKSYRVGRYQHMLPVNRVRSEANVARRSSLEESPTYNMVTSRASLYSSLPRVKTRLKLLSNNTYAPVFDQEMQRNEHPDADQNDKLLNVKKSASDAVECGRNQRSCKSSMSAAFENLQVKLCFGNKRRQRSRGRDEATQKLPKLKFVVASEPALSFSHVEQLLEDDASPAADKQAEENMLRRARRKRRQREVGKTKACSNNASADSLPAVDRSTANQSPSSITADVSSCHTEHRSTEVEQVADREPPGEKSEPDNFTEQLSGHPPQLSDSRHSVKEDCIETVQSMCCDAAAAADDDESLPTASSADTDELCAGQGRVSDASSQAHTAAVQLEAGKSESVSTDETTKSSPLPAESYCSGTDTIHASSVEDTDNEKHHADGSNFHSDVASDSLNAGQNAGTVDWLLAEKLPPPPDDGVSVATEEMSTSAEHASTSSCSAACDRAPASTEPDVTITSVSADDRLTRDTFTGTSDHDSVAVFDDSSVSGAVEPTLVAMHSDTVGLSLSSPLLGDDDSPICSELPPCSNDGNSDEADCGKLSSTLTSAVVTEDASLCASDRSDTCTEVVNTNTAVCAVDSVELASQVTKCLQDITQEVADSSELCENNLKFESVSSVSGIEHEPGDGCEQIISDPACSFDTPSHLSSPCYSKEQKEMTVANSACSNGFLAAFTQFVNNVSVKKKSRRFKDVCETGGNSESAEEITLKPGCSETIVRRKVSPSQRRNRFVSSAKTTARKNRSPHCVADDEAISTAECASAEDAGSSVDTDCLQRLTAADGERRPTVCGEELANLVTSHCRLVWLRHRVCQLVETLLPGVQLPSGLQRDSASVERFVQDITDVLSDGEAHTRDTRRCSDPIVVLHRMPDQCLQSLQQQVVRLVSLLLPGTDFSDISSDTLDVFLELVTSVNRPSPGSSFGASQSNLRPSEEASPQSGSTLPQQGSLSSPCRSDTDSRQADTSLSRSEGHTSAADTLFSMPGGLLHINSPGPAGDKRSIRRQVKDCLMFLDRDLT